MGGTGALRFFTKHYGHLPTEQVTTIIYLHYSCFFIAIVVAVIICNYLFRYIGGDVSWLSILTDRNYGGYGACFLAIIFIAWFLLTGILHSCIVPLVFT